MNDWKNVALKVELAMMFVDLKALFMIWMVADIYRNTALASGVLVNRTLSMNQGLQQLWQETASPYVVWIPVIIILDFLIKKGLRVMTDD